MIFFLLFQTAFVYYLFIVNDLKTWSQIFNGAQQDILRLTNQTDLIILYDLKTWSQIFNGAQQDVLRLTNQTDLIIL